MTALEEWRAWTKEPFEWNDVPDWEALQTETEEYAHNAINELLAEVAALKAQRCETCGHKGAEAYRDTPNPTCSCNLNARWNHLDFACNRWEEATSQGV